MYVKTTILKRALKMRPFVVGDRDVASFTENNLPIYERIHCASNDFVGRFKGALTLLWLEYF